MKATELREKSVEELNTVLKEQLKEQFTLRMKKTTGQLTETHKIKEVRVNIARLKTVLNEKAGE